MLRTSDSETEILLGNKQLIGIFFVVAVLLGIAFYGGYMVGRGAGKVPPAPAPAVAAETAANPNPPGETHSFPADTAAPADHGSAPAAVDVHPKRRNAEAPSPSEPPPLGSPNRKPLETAQATEPAPVSNIASDTFAPQSGEEFLQVAAVARDEAEAVANVLHKKGFEAHAVPKPGNQKLYRVLIGPLRDAGELSSTRDALRRTGFREVIVQRY